MKIILSPTKKMKSDIDSLPCRTSPVFLQHTQRILSAMQEKSYQELKKLWTCNDTIAQQNYERLQTMDLHHNLTPAILSYEGIAYRYMAPAAFEENQFDYVQAHLRILSGFYGVLKPMDGIQPYRLEMKTRMSVGDCLDLYAFWGKKLYQEVRDDGIVVNLASKEYAQAIERYLTPQDTYLTCSFCEMAQNRLLQKGTFAKMARGEMVRYMAENEIENPREIRHFDRLGYKFSPEFSNETHYIFIKSEC